ncbi:uncharacterized protein METZ01_LOCUS441015, partial [marine metagenome]
MNMRLMIPAVMVTGIVALCLDGATVTVKA